MANDEKYMKSLSLFKGSLFVAERAQWTIACKRGKYRIKQDKSEMKKTKLHGIQYSSNKKKKNTYTHNNRTIQP